MDCAETGALIRALRLEKGLTQNRLGAMLGLSGKTVSKWERGLGCPDVSVLSELGAALEVDIGGMLAGRLPAESPHSGNMKKANYFVCPSCGGLTVSAGGAVVFCCGRRLEPLGAKSPDQAHELKLEPVEDEWYVTSGHPMSREHYISFAALSSDDRVQLFRFYPQWNIELRLPRQSEGTLLWYCTGHGLFSRRL